MRVTKFNSSKTVLLRINKYAIDWQNDGNSSLEVRFRKLIYPWWKNYIVLFQPTIPGSRLKLDFLNCNKKIAVEINGPQHSEFNKFFHGSRAGYLGSLKRDMSKYKWLNDNKIQLLELEEQDLNNFSPIIIEEKFGVNIL